MNRAISRRVFNCTVLFLFSLLTPSLAEAGQLETGSTYRLEVSLTGLSLPDGTGSYDAARACKFVVLDSVPAGGYSIRFVSVYDLETKESQFKSTVRVDDSYLLPKSYKGVAIEKAVSSVISGPVSGPLVIPFKFRLDDHTLAGDAAIGYYAGYSVSMPIGNGNRLPITPFASAGISQVQVTENGGNRNRTSFTWSCGLLIQDWNKINIGIVYGQDRIGEDAWEHEGKGWFSFMIGWKIE